MQLIGISSSFNARFAGQYALQLLETFATNNGGSGKQLGASAKIGVIPARETGGAVESIMLIIMDAKGNASVKINSPDSADTITLNLTERMAEADKLHLAYKSGTQSLVIADDQFFIDNPPGQTVFVRPEAARKLSSPASLPFAEKSV